MRTGIALTLLWLVSPLAVGAPPRVLVVPFEPVAEEMRRETLGKGLADTLAVELAAGRRFEPTLFSAPQIENSHLGFAGARRLARESDAAFVVFGSYQIYEGQARITGYVVREQDGQIIGSLKATGADSQLFALQDMIAGQAKRALPSAASPTTTEAEVKATKLPPIEPIAYSGPLTMRLTTYTPEVWQPRPMTERFAADYDRYYRRPIMGYYSFWGWTCWRRWNCWGPGLYW